MVVVFNSDIVFRLLYRLYFNVLHQSLHGLFLDGVSLPHVKKQNKTKQNKTKQKKEKQPIAVAMSVEDPLTIVKCIFEFVAS